jgi:formate dehydrogenase subunit delta
MNVDHMVKMANEIGAFFAAESPPGQASKDVANHLKRFWDPRMRREIVAHYRLGGAGLSDLALAAVGLLATESGTAAGAAPQSSPPSADRGKPAG